ncbi:hypothetical protein C8R43DRAFT_964963 [Mycena crocata]|nr:hypothetical protein C8R43DRAFT_964963 [Mycena crocata]
MTLPSLLRNCGVSGGKLPVGGNFLRRQLAAVAAKVAAVGGGVAAKVAAVTMWRRQSWRQGRHFPRYLSQLGGKVDGNVCIRRQLTKPSQRAFSPASRPFCSKLEVFLCASTDTHDPAGGLLEVEHGVSRSTRGYSVQPKETLSLEQLNNSPTTLTWTFTGPVAHDSIQTKDQLKSLPLEARSGGVAGLKVSGLYTVVILRRLLVTRKTEHSPNLKLGLGGSGGNLGVT